MEGLLARGQTDRRVSLQVASLDHHAEKKILIMKIDGQREGIMTGPPLMEGWR